MESSAPRRTANTRHVATLVDNTKAGQNKYLRHAFVIREPFRPRSRQMPYILSEFPCATQQKLLASPWLTDRVCAAANLKPGQPGDKARVLQKPTKGTVRSNKTCPVEYFTRRWSSIPLLLWAAVGRGMEGGVKSHKVLKARGWKEWLRQGGHLPPAYTAGGAANHH